jgi:internalin A
MRSANWLRALQLGTITCVVAAGIAFFLADSKRTVRQDEQALITMLENNAKFVERSTTSSQYSIGDIVGVHFVDFQVPEGLLDRLGSLPNLRKLSLAGRSFDDISARRLYRLTELEWLNLEGSVINDVDLEQLQELRSLKVVCLRDTSVTDKGMHRLSRLEDLQAIDLNGTSIGNQGLETLSQLKQLREILLNGTKVTNDGLRSLRNNGNLQQLRLNDTNVSDCGLEWLSGLERLDTLWLAGTRITDDGLQQFWKLQELRILHLNNTGIKGDGLRWIPLRNLQYLDLSGTQITNENMAHLETASQLTNLVIDRTNVGDSCLPHLKPLTSLEILFARQTLITCKGADELQHALPELLVHLR